MTILLCISICVVLSSSLAAVNGRANIDLYVAVDSKVQDVYTKANQTVNTQDDVEYMLTELNKLFERQQGVDIGVRVVKLDVLNMDLFQGVNGRVNSSVAFEDFRKYVKANHLHSQYAYDVALLFTGYLTVSDTTGGHVVGHYSDDKHCDDDSVAVVHYDGTAHTILLAAGMIAGVLGVTQDSGDCIDGYIRNPRLYPGMKHQFEFSPCSIRELQAAIARDDCLKIDSPNSRIPDSKPSTDMLDMDKMCKRAGNSFLSRDASLYNLENLSGDVICHSTYCFDSASPNAYGIQTTEGLVCAAGKRCSFGKCMDAPSDFPVPSNVKDSCVFGDSPSIGDGSTQYTCPGYFRHSSRRNDCSYNWFRAQCCETCDKFGDVAQPTKHPDCPNEDDSWCHHYSRAILCASSARSSCCTYCVNYTPDDPIVG